MNDQYVSEYRAGLRRIIKIKSFSLDILLYFGLGVLLWGVILIGLSL